LSRQGAGAILQKGRLTSCGDGDSRQLRVSALLAARPSVGNSFLLAALTNEPRMEVNDEHPFQDGDSRSGRFHPYSFRIRHG
jgi:hypothetical protein